jgi:predicted enzyme related to lactoylglutathione lyase
MGERSSYAPGTFCWAELTTTDQDAAKAFYGALLGWQPDDRPVGDAGSYYSMQLIDGKPVAAIAAQPEQQREAGVHAPPFDVMSVGRMAVIQDPQGAFFAPWEPRDHIGASLVNRAGALVWNELQSPDLPASAAFYSELFGWQMEDASGALGTYLTIKNGGANNGGIRELTPPSPPNWLVYFGVADVEHALARLDELGGSTIAGPIDIEIAKIAVVADPQGAVFALYAGQLDD